MESTAKDREATALFIRKHAREIGELFVKRWYLEGWWPVDRSDTNENRIEWCTTGTLELADFIEFGNIAPFDYRFVYRGNHSIPGDTESKRFHDFVVSELFHGRTVLEFIRNNKSISLTEMTAMEQILEQAKREIVQYNLDIFADYIKTPGQILRSWRHELEDTKEIDLDSYQPPELEIDAFYQDIPKPAYGTITAREQQIISHVIAGESNATIAQELDISANTVRNILVHIFEKYDVHSRIELISKLVIAKE